MGEKSNIQWTGRRFGRIKQFCKKNNISLNDYLENVSKGIKWCTGCKTWHNVTSFRIDKSRYDGYSAICAQMRNKISRSVYSPKPRPSNGRRFVPPRNEDRKQARRRVNYLVESRLIPHPNELPCFDCGHIWNEGERRHEYDHYKGYEIENHESVQSVCSTCHYKRTHHGNKN